MNRNNLLRSRKNKLIAIILVFAFVSPFFISDQIRLLAGATNEDSKNDLVANAKKPLDSVNITELGFWDDNYGEISEVVFDGDLAYLALGLDGFLVLNISSLEGPEVITTWEEDECNRIYASGNLIYVANATGFKILDATNFSSINMVCNYSIGITIYDIYGQGNFVYYTDDLGFHCINVTTYQNPLYNGGYFNGGLREFQVDSRYSFVVDSDRVRIINITDTTVAPQQLFSILLANTRDVFYADNYIYFNSEDFVYVWNWTTKTGVGSQTDLYAFNNTGPNNIFVQGDYLYVEEGDRLIVVDVSNKTNVLYYSQYLNSLKMDDLLVNGNEVYVYNIHSIEAINATDPMNMNRLWLDQIAGFSWGFFIDDDYAYIADIYNLEIVDISDPENPVEVGQFFDNFDYPIYDVVVKDDYAYILEVDMFVATYLKIIDVSDPTNPIELGNVSYNGPIEGLCVSDDYAYVGLGVDGFGVVDIFYPEYPQFALAFDEIPDVWDLAYAENYLYLAAGEYFHVVDMTNPYNPEPYSNWTRLSADYISIHLEEEYAYVISAGEGFDIIDITTDLLEPVKVGQFFTWVDPVDIFVEDSYIYMLDNSQRFDVFDATIIGHPKLIGNYSDGRDHTFIWADNGYIYLGADINGTRILQTNPTLSKGLPSIGPFAIFTGLAMLSVIIVFICKKKRH